MVARSIPRLRPLSLADLPQVVELDKKVFGSQGRQAALSEWEWRLMGNRAACSVPSLGWVLEVQDRVVGLLAAIPQFYQVRGEIHLAAAASTFGVEPEFRQQGLRLALAFCQQSETPILLNTTANKLARIIFERFHFAALDGYDVDQLILLCPRQAFTHILRPRIGRWAHVVAAVLTILTRPYLGLRYQDLQERTSPIEVRDVEGCDSEFNALWDSVRGEYFATAARTVEILQWRFFDGPVARCRARVLGAFRGGALVGYLAWREVISRNTRSAQVVDFFTSRTTPEVFAALLSKLVQQALDEGLGLVLVRGTLPEFQRVIEKWHPFTRPGGLSPFLYRLNLPGCPKLTTAELKSWHATGLDGDATMS